MTIASPLTTREIRVRVSGNIQTAKRYGEGVTARRRWAHGQTRAIITSLVIYAHTIGGDAAARVSERAE